MKYLITVLSIIIIWFFAGNHLINFKSQAGYVIGRILRWPESNERKELKLKNEVLRAELSQLKQQISNAPKKFLSAKVYARYPFNTKSRFSINIGKSDGVKIGMVATVEGVFLVGKVEKVFNNYSLVKTIFTPNWQIPARVGEERIEGLFTGGASPSVGMIAEDEEIKEGDVVFVADQNFPYGLKIGEIGKINKGEITDVFQSAGISFPYDNFSLTELWLIK